MENEKDGSIRHALAERALERASQWQPVHVRSLPDPEKLDEIALLGCYSFSLVESRRRLLKDTLELEDGIYETPSAVARDYLRLQYKQAGRGTRTQLRNVASIEPVPNVAQPRKFAHGAYVDIKACYWSIMLIAGWNVDYNPGLWLSAGRPPDDFPFPEHHVARDCLVSAGRTLGIPRYNPHKLPGDPYDEIQVGNGLKNLQLSRLIHDVLNCIGVEALKSGAIYMNNDGLIAPSMTIARTLEHIIEDWGLTWKIKGEGSGEVKAAGTYRVGMSQTETWKTVYEERPLKLLYKPPYADWLKQEFSFLAATRGVA